MFHSLKYEVTFPSTGRTLQADLQFDTGFAAITGSNEAGKTMILEMLRFLLFGSQALRGAAEDYRTLKARGAFTIRDVRYSVERSMRRAELKRGEDVVASGVTPVNEKIVQLLGFGLAIFDVANAINQGEVERLGSMTSGERKRLVDSVLGIDALDVVARWGLDEARLLDGQVRAIRTTLVQPTAPAEPVGYMPGIDIDAVRAQSRELAEIRGWLAHSRVEPIEPVCTVSTPFAELVNLAEAQAERRRQRAELQARIDALPTTAPVVPDDIEEQWSRYDRYLEAQTWLAAHPLPKYPTLTLRIFLDDHTALENITARAAIQDRIDRLSAKGSKPCPHCEEDIPLEDEAIKRLEAERDTLVVPNNGVVPPKPPLSRQDIQLQLHYVSTFDEAKHREMTAVEACGQPTIRREQIPTLRRQITLAAERVSLLPALELLSDEGPDYQAQLLERRSYEQALTRYETELESYRLWTLERQAKQDRQAELQGVDYAALEAAYAVARDYEQALARFERDWDHYQAKSDEADQLEAEANKHRKVRELMNVLRSLIKQHLMPSLNKVSSHLLHGMTGGQRSEIFVDEDFNVAVDQQRLDTLSGSGKACANLSLRIALGQVLTNRVFSVLLADEIDASMDDFRAEQTADVLGMLEKSISQVLLVSHKSIEANKHISLGGFVDPVAGSSA